MADFKDDLLCRLKDLKYAAEYVTAALEEGESVFLLAVRDVARDHGVPRDELRLQMAAAILGGMVAEIGDYYDPMNSALKWADQLIERALGGASGEVESSVDGQQEGA